MLFGLFNKKKGEKDQNQFSTSDINFSFLGADMHSHIIPSIDDGAKTIEDSLELIKGMTELGYKTIVTTPHIMVDYYPNTSTIIQSGLEKLRNALKENNLNIHIKAAAEYYIDEYFAKLLKSEPLLTIYQNEVLVECSMLYETPILADVLFNLATLGYRPVLAHPERYTFFHKNLDKYQELKDRGCLLQLNILSMMGYYGKNIKIIAEELLEKNMYDYLGTDIHHNRHISAIKDMVPTPAFQLIANYPFLNSRLCL